MGILKRSRTPGLKEDLIPSTVVPLYPETRVPLPGSPFFSQAPPWLLPKKGFCYPGGSVIPSLRPPSSVPGATRAGQPNGRRGRGFQEEMKSLPSCHSLYHTPRHSQNPAGLAGFPGWQWAMLVRDRRANTDGPCLPSLYFGTRSGEMLAPDGDSRSGVQGQRQNREGPQNGRLLAEGKWE